MAKPPAKKPPRKPTVRAPAKRQTGAAAAIEAGMTDEIRSEIVMRLAMFDKVKDVQADLLDRGIDISHQAIAKYNAVNNPSLAAKWRDLFQTTRDNFLAEMAAEPIAHRAYRLRKLDHILRIELQRGNTVGARATLEQAAKEMGDAFTNVVKQTGQVNHAHLHAAHPGQTTIDEKRNMLSERIAEGLKRLPALPPPEPTGVGK